MSIVYCPPRCAGAVCAQALVASTLKGNTGRPLLLPAPVARLYAQGEHRGVLAPPSPSPSDNKDPDSRFDLSVYERLPRRHHDKSLLLSMIGLMQTSIDLRILLNQGRTCSDRSA